METNRKFKKTKRYAPQSRGREISPVGIFERKKNPKIINALMANPMMIAFNVFDLLKPKSTKVAL